MRVGVDPGLELRDRRQRRDGPRRRHVRVVPDVRERHRAHQRPPRRCRQARARLPEPVDLLDRVERVHGRHAREERRVHLPQQRGEFIQLLFPQNRGA